jgi:basic membrane protein A
MIRKVEVPKLNSQLILRALSSIALAIFLVLTQSVKSPTLADTVNSPLKVGFIMVGSLNDLGWNYQHNLGRLYMQSKLKGQVETTAVENVPESGEVERVMEKMIAQGNKLIFATSYGYLEPALRVAARHPEIIIMQCGRPNTSLMKNVGTYFGNYYEPFYVAGLVAGRMTRKNEIGYVGPHSVPPALIMLNAFTLGARSINPKVKVHVVWTNSWSDPATEAEAARGLVDKGVDVLVQHADSSKVATQIAEKNGLYSVGVHSDIHNFAPKGWLTGQAWDWGEVYVKITKSVLNHTWKPGDVRYGLKDGSVKLSSFGPSVPQPVRAEAITILQKMTNGQFDIFKGPISDREGNVRIPAGKVADHSYLEKIDWVVPGVAGSLPKK